MKFEELSENSKEKAINDLVNFYVNTVMSYDDIRDETIWCSNVLHDFINTQKETLGINIDLEKISFDVSDPAGGDNFVEFEIPEKIPSVMFEFLFKQLASITQDKNEKKKILDVLNESLLFNIFCNQKVNSREKNHIYIDWDTIEEGLDELNPELYDDAISQKTFNNMWNKLNELRDDVEEKFTDLFNGLAISLLADLEEEVESIYKNAKESVKDYDYDENGNIIPIDMR